MFFGTPISIALCWSLPGTPPLIGALTATLLVTIPVTGYTNLEKSNKLSVITALGIDPTFSALVLGEVVPVGVAAVVDGEVGKLDAPEAPNGFLGIAKDSKVVVHSFLVILWFIPLTINSKDVG